MESVSSLSVLQSLSVTVPAGSLAVGPLLCFLWSGWYDLLYTHIPQPNRRLLSPSSWVQGLCSAMASKVSFLYRKGILLTLCINPITKWGKKSWDDMENITNNNIDYTNYYIYFDFYVFAEVNLCFFSHQLLFILPESTPSCISICMFAYMHVQHNTNKQM